MDRNEKARIITQLCEDNDCSAKIAKMHFQQFVDRGWHPHPPAEFETWWTAHPDFKEGIDAKRAYNCLRYRDEFLEAKQHGITEPKTFKDVQTIMQGGS